MDFLNFSWIKKEPELLLRRKAPGIAEELEKYTYKNKNKI